MKKQDFTIEGSIPLKEAFVKESGLKNSSINWDEYLTSSSSAKNALTSVIKKFDKHFKLPQQWDEALEYVKDYFTEEPEFKVGAFITFIKATENSEVDHVGDVLQITNIRDDSFHEKWIYHTGNSFSGGAFKLNSYKSSIRRATEEEILTHLQKEFTERTGIDIGSEVMVIPHRKRYIKKTFCKGDASWRSTYNVRGFKIINNELFIDINSYAWKPREVWHECDALELAKPKLTFGDNEVTLKKVSSGVRIHCGGEEGTLSQLEKIYNELFIGSDNVKFGSVKVKTVEYTDGGEWTDELSNTVSRITLGCTTGTAKEFLKVLEEARKLN